MKRHKLAVAVVALVAVLFGLTPDAWAPGGNVLPPCVVVDSTGQGIPSGGPEMSGTLAMKVADPAAFLATGAGTAEVAMWLKFRSKQTETSQFVRGIIPVSAAGLPTGETVICSILDKVNGLGDDILSAFQLPNTKQLKICFSNPTSSAEKFNCRSLSSYDYEETTGLGLGTLDRIFIVD